MADIRGGATFVEVGFTVPDATRESKAFVVLFVGGDLVEEGLEPPPGMVWKEPGAAGAEFDSVGCVSVFINRGGG